jgi:hypothetical protein
MHPEYPSQAGINAGAARGVLEAVFGNGQEGFVVRDISDARLTRQFSSFVQMDQEQKEVRIWAAFISAIRWRSEKRLVTRSPTIS